MILYDCQRPQNCQTKSKLLQLLSVGSSMRMLPQHNFGALCNSLLPKPICFASFSSWTRFFRQRFIGTLHGLVAVTQWKWAQPVQLLAQRVFISQARQGTFRLWEFLSFFRYVLRVRHHKLLKRRNHKCMAALRLQPSELFWEFAP